MPTTNTTYISQLREILLANQGADSNISISKDLASKLIGQYTLAKPGVTIAIAQAVANLAREGSSAGDDGGFVFTDLKSNDSTSEGHALLGLGLGRIVEGEVLRLPAEFLDWYILEWQKPVQKTHDENTLNTKRNYLDNWAEEGSFGDMYIDWMFAAWQAGKNDGKA